MLIRINVEFFLIFLQSISSFKRTIMILIALDLICIPVAITFYFLYDESAIYLNLIHIKSVFSMYFVILSRKTLLKLIFKKICPFWPGTDTSNIFEIHRQETLAQLNKFRQTWIVHHLETIQILVYTLMHHTQVH